MEKEGAVQDLVQKPHLHIFTSTILAMGSMLLDDNTSFTLSSCHNLLVQVQNSYRKNICDSSTYNSNYIGYVPVDLSVKIQ